MTRDDIIRIANEAGMEWYGSMHIWHSPTDDCAYPEGVFPDVLERFAALVAIHTTEKMIESGWRQCAVEQRTTQFCGATEAAIKEEREACAQVCDNYDNADPLGVSLECAAVIRARGTNAA